MANATCAHCGGRMERGFVLDHAHLDVEIPARWVQGEPRVSLLGGLRTGGRRRMAIRAFSLHRCGLLEQYALDEDGL